jgi:hypothetical protein
MAPPEFTEASAECRRQLQPPMPRWRRSISAALLVNPKHRVPNKLVALAVDESADKAVSIARRATIADRAQVTEEVVRHATKALVADKYLSRTQTGSRSWNYRLLRREPAALLPGWALHWKRSALGAQLPPAGLLLWALAIHHRPTHEQQAAEPWRGPWMEVSHKVIASELKVSVNTVPKLLRETADAGLLLAVTRPRHPAIVVPMTEAVTRAQRDDLVSCLIDVIHDREPDFSSTPWELAGWNAATVWDDEDLVARIGRHLPSPPLPAQTRGHHDALDVAVDVPGLTDVLAIDRIVEVPA